MLFIGILMVCVVVRMIAPNKISGGIAVLFIAYVFIILYGFGIAMKNDLLLSAVFQRIKDYVRPPLFILCGYLFFKKRNFDLFLIVLLFFLIAGSIMYYSNPAYFIMQSLIKSDLPLENAGTFVSFAILRNGSVLLTPLETGFVCFFLMYHFIVKSQDNRMYLLWAAVSCAILITTYTRSAMLALVIALLTRAILFSKAKMILFIVFFIIACLLAIAYLCYSDVINYVLFNNPSSEVHFSNFYRAIGHIGSNLFGYGLGSSGLKGDLSSSFYVYSEGSLFTNLIEIGLPILLIYFLLGYYTFQHSPFYLFPAFTGFTIASVMIPIGLSMFFAMVFYTACGTVMRKGDAIAIEKNRCVT
jgi:hypothetical protein